MGMFDSVYANCPSCDTLIEFQSKGGECELRKYLYTNVPVDVAKYVSGDSASCPKCGKILRLKMPEPEPRIALILETNETLEWD